MNSMIARLPFPVIQPDWPDLPSNIRAFSTSRRGGFSAGVYGNQYGVEGFNLGDHVADDIGAVSANRALLNQYTPHDVMFFSQVHGNIVLDAGSIHSGLVGDAAFSNAVGTVCAVLTADCLPVLFADKAGRCVAAAHAGWRGLAGGILQRTVDRMRVAGASELTAWMGPAIGPAKFEVGQDVMDVFSSGLSDVEQYFRPKTDAGEERKYLADIYGLARATLAKHGVVDVYGGSYCTVSDPAHFYSYRRDGVTGRMGHLIWIDQPR
ncbi:peptidoglycan editing factor PgeF [Undibacterium sp. SXout7W]|uniref:peptidoglycan editing factor PgeF n=1 Tax=Undibacterium sp. SXout7W TaxID=3413049 RepID=UPI003BF0259E